MRVRFWEKVRFTPCREVKSTQGYGRFMRMLPGVEDQSYTERLGSFGLYSLEHRRVRDDLILVYKMTRALGRVHAQSLLPRLRELRIRGLGFKVRGETFNGNLKGNLVFGGYMG